MLLLVRPPAPSARSRELRELLSSRRPALMTAAARHGVSNLRVFGSVARGDARPGSDIDLLVDVEPSRSLLELAALLLELQEILGVRVDIVEASALRPEDDDILTDAIAV
jgi:predicted nucleotidyltransferase